MQVKSALMPVAALLLGVSLLLTGQGLQGTLLPVRASLESFSAVSIGIIGGAYFLGFTLGCLKGGDLVARVGHVRVFAAMTAVASAVPLLHGLLLDQALWSLFRFTTGFCFAVLYIVIESWLNELATNETRGIVFSTYVMISLVVLALGQMLMLAHDPRELFLFAVISVLVSIAVVPVVLSTAPGPKQPHSVSVNMRRLFNISPAGTVTCLGNGLTNGAFWAMAPVFIVGISNNASNAAWFMTASVLGGAIFQWPIGHLSDRIGRRTVMIGCALGSAIVAAFIVAMGHSLSFTGLALLGSAWGAASFSQYPVAVANANDHADPSEYVMVSSGLLLMYGVGAIVGPLFASLAMTAYGGTALYGYTATVHVLISLYIMFRVTRRTSAPDEQHVDFNESLVAAHTKSQVYEQEASDAAEDGVG